MGRKRNHKGKHNNSKKQKTEQASWRSSDDRFNSKWEAYYKAQNIVPEKEFEAFHAAFNEDLPVSFRLSSINGYHQSLVHRLQQGEFGTEKSEFKLPGETKSFCGPQPLLWYPNNLAWTLSCSKNNLRKVPELAAFREFLIRESEHGNINRQEAVSMLPPLFLDVEPHHIVLDMCAAPGSKTAQILEALHRGDVSSSPAGMVVANDADEKRAYMLVHQLKRFSSPCFLVTTHNGQFFPTLFKASATTTAAETKVEEPVGAEGEEDFTVVPGRTVIKFDRILADVPCSGDGTFRKSPNLWSVWDTHLGIGLHPLQLAIAIRGLQMLKVGGTMVYSTCALNPIEDEAVVAQLLRGSKGTVELVDVSTKLPELKRSAGISTWTVQGRGETAKDGKPGACYAFFDEVPGAKRKRIRRTMFPPTAEEAATMHLDRAFRVLPHHNNTGGFFVAVLRKTAEIPSTFTVSTAGPEPAPLWVNRGLPSTNTTSTATTTAAAAATNVVVAAAASNTETALSTAEPRSEVIAAATTTITTTITTEDETSTTTTVITKEETVVVHTSTDGDTKMASIVEEQEPAKVDEEADDDAADADVQSVLAMVDGGTAEGGDGKKSKKKPFNEDPFVMLETDIFNPLKEFYGMNDEFRRENLFGRSALGRKVYFLNSAVSSIVSNPQNHKLKIVHTGLRCFESRHELERGIAKYSEKEGAPVGAGFMYRICQEGVYHIKQMMSKQLLRCNRDQLAHMLKLGTVRFEGLKTSGDESLLDLERQIAATQKGCVVASMAHAAGSFPSQSPCFCLWRTENSVCLMISKEDKQFYAQTLDIKLA